ncbi:DUF3667 domain-containing protein [Psychroflexus sp. YR1-1]|uniref:DUF3667 domain-containing protein n=1 Tax=Psychroflexus aurantiacus TaxID=2709310 RepID=A0A6B3R2N0_9FLAO|nr:DUF3667 domain-containing protein [Psychroflexus aurantiacus]NEV94592.1 DUF3667 domain-containing protein [Psychroflexus aurantiacus]
MKFKLPLNTQPKPFQHRAESCLNCGHSLDISERYCSYCGQKNSTKALNLKALITEFFAGLVSYDSRFRKSVSALVCSPGKLSREYIQGKRITYVNPFRFFISTAIVFFIMVSWMNRDALRDIKILTDKEIEANPETINSDLEFMKDLPESKITKYIKEHPKTNYSEAITALGMEDTLMNQVKFEFMLGYTRLIENPTGFVNFLLPKFPFFLFFFIPLFTLFNTLLYIRRKIPYTHHLIFNYNQQTVFLILLFLNLILGFISLWIWLLIYFFYLYKSMRKFYEQGRFKTILKQLVIMNLYWISALLVLSSLATLSIIFF